MTSDRVAAAAKVIDQHQPGTTGEAISCARDMAAQGLLAPEMQEEWGVTGQWTPHIEWFSDRDSAERFMKKVSPADPHLVCRYVTAAEKEEQQ